MEGEPRPLLAGIDLSAYRIVQEGLTNALKHAGPARAEVLVRYEPTRARARGDRRRARLRPDRANGGGHGLVGMRERVAVYGGELDRRAARRRGRLRAASARLPVEAGAARVIRVLIADDQALVRDGFGMILDAQADIEVVGQAADGREAVEHGARRCAPTSC